VKNPVSTRKLKYDGTLKSTWEGHLIAEEEGWLVVYYDSPQHEVGSGAVPAHAIRYFSLEQPLSVLVSFDDAGRILEFQCDAALPQTIAGRQIDMLDLDLDLMVAANGSAHVRDQDTFARNVREMSYPVEVRQAAQAGIRLAERLFVDKLPPFGGHAERMLGMALASEGPL